MAWKLWTRSRCPIGIDFGAHSIKMIQLERRDEGFAVAAAASRTLPGDMPATPPQRAELISGLIRQMLEGGKFAGQRVVSSLPATALQYKNLRLPRMPADELRAAVEWEAGDRLKITPASMHLQFFDAGEVRQGEELRREIILLAAEKQVVEEHLEILSRSELTPIAIDAIPGALARCLAFRLPKGEDGAAHVVLDVGYSSSKVLMLRDGQVVFFKLMEIGGRKLNETLAQHLGLSTADAADLRRRLQEPGRASGGGGDGEQLFGSTRRDTLERAVFEALRSTAGELAKEVALCLRYFSVTFRGKRPETLLLTGGEAYEPQLAKILSEGADIQVEAIEPLAGMDFSSAVELAGNTSRLSEWAVAAGLSMRNGETRVEGRGAKGDELANSASAYPPSLPLASRPAPLDSGDKRGAA